MRRRSRSAQIGTWALLVGGALLWACDDSADSAGAGHGGGHDAGPDGGPDGGDGDTEPKAAIGLELVGAALQIKDNTNAPLYLLSCSNALVLEKADGEDWVAPQDDRHPGAANPGYYLDGKYIAPSFNLGCDVVDCYQASDPISAFLAYEYVKVGSMPPPEDVMAPDFGVELADPADVVETRPLSGKVRVVVRYSRDDDCATQLERIVELTVPEPDEGVCCPVGAEGCSAEGPGGGWAPTAEACAPFSQEFDALFERKDDPRGCPALVANYEECCGCAP